jgi:hypothetical protein
MRDDRQFGVVLVGAELLCGKHLSHVIQTLQARVQLMDELSAAHVHARLFSLPHMAEIKTIEPGFRGEQDAVEAAFSDLLKALTTRALEFEGLQQGVATDALRQIVV